MGGLSTRRPARGAVLAVSCLVALLTSGCSADDPGARGSATPSKSTGSARPAAASAQGSARGEHIDGETVTEAPQIIDGEVIESVANVRGNRVMELDGGVRPGPVSIAVNCQGKGTLTVELKPVGLSFPLECVDGEVSSTYNQIALKKARKDAVLQVTAGSGVRWALTVGQ
ncbi:hypothetical protein ACFYWX_08135 [Streptomyces sp. NPDC002888]|uniref:hypothetical protein n=1 Tax=Streptomyces sp. NPDC002888 TaxID=3364668 RepID=UPI0036944780